ncbi:ABC transporter substrate-binding protein [Paraburkholderia lycopersici]|uniref:ABC-type nitrate/sulfonate/bicarbonate transport system, substrate-binding protein n=1 Tax=Paraburkholderia lycopersici TaxID=416944 RepID=A0A1G6HAT8_9BURK|nr:ABC transporter substrate-binding protein [Paraburkholderia lycopersici]SDB91198.1 ABC-type nitrate/sulfonate/bicarbonate transport system, substrate-binding protein [Paraburkholderia lycopersici]
MTDTRPSAAPASSTPLTYARSPVPTPLGIAIHLGWLNGDWSENGVAIRSAQSGVALADRVSQNEHMLANSFFQGGSIPAMWARSRGADTRVIGLSWIDETQQIVTLASSGIQGVKQLRSRRLGLPLRQHDTIDVNRATALRGFLNALSLEGLTARDVEFVDIDAHAVPNATPYLRDIEALRAGTVDAIYVKGAHGELAVRGSAYRCVIDLGFHPDPLVRNNNGTPRPLTVNGAVLKNFPDLVDGFLRLIAAAGDWARVHQRETLEFVSREAGAPVTAVQSAYGNRLHLHLGIDLAQGSIEALGTFGHFLFEHGYLPTAFSVADWIHPGPLARVDALRNARSA